MTRQLFDAVAAEYDAVRPDYPAQLYDAVESVMGQPLLGADVLDVGAGTGIATRALAGRGARVVALDPGAAVLDLLTARSTSRVRAVLGDANALPFRDDIFDLVVFAQSMHWTDLARSCAESLRVLKPGGVLAAWWNRGDRSVRWYAEHQARFHAACDKPEHQSETAVGGLLAAPPFCRNVASVEIPWSRSISLENYRRLLHTHSYVCALGNRAGQVVDEELSMLARLFPDGSLLEPMSTYAVLARA